MRAKIWCKNHIYMYAHVQALAEKEKGNEAYKQKDFITALARYDNAIKLDPTNVTFLTNKAGRQQSS